jgi:alpha-glucoside transport system substrate-binding protein
MNRLIRGLGLLIVLAFALAACGPAAAPAPTEAMPAATEAMPAATEAMPAATEAMPAAAIDCAGAQSGDELSMLYQWSGEEEAKLNQILKPLVDACGIVLKPESTRDQGLLDTRVQAGTPPDVAFWNVTQLVQYKDMLKPMDSLGAVKDNYIPGAIDPGVIDGAWLGLPVKTDVKSIIWYSPANFEALGYTVPTTWDELDALVEKMVADGNVPWSMGLESGDATGWTGSDFIQDIMLVQQGPQYVMNIINGSVPYNDPGVKAAYETYGKWAADSKYTVGGAKGTLSTNFNDAILKVFSDPPEAMMVKQSGFAGGTITAQYPNDKVGTDYDFFMVPGLKGLQGGSDWMMAFSDSAAVKALVTYLSSPLGGENWAKAGFALSPNKGGQGNFTDPALVKQAAAFYTSEGLTPDIGDSIPGGFNTAEWKAIVDYLNGADLDTELANVAAVQKTALGK